MSATTTAPVAITPEARAFIDEVGQRREFDMMIDRARHVVPGLRAIEVVLDEATEELSAGVVLWAHRDNTGSGNDPTQQDWIDWLVVTFPPDVCRNFTLLPVYHNHER
jgi:hypothetical protein